MGRHTVVETDAPTVQLRASAIRESASGTIRPASSPTLLAVSGADSNRPRPATDSPAEAVPAAVTAWVRAKSWSKRRSTAAMIGTHVGLTALSCVLVFPSWMFWAIAVAGATVAITKSSVLGFRLLGGLCVAAVCSYLVRFAIISALVYALGYDRTESVELSACLAHVGSVVLAATLAALIDPDVRARRRSLWAQHQPALTSTTLRAVLTVGLTILLLFAALLPIVRTLSDTRGFSAVTAASDRASSTTETAATTALGCAITTSSGTADSTCTRNALIERVCHLDVTQVDPAAASNGMTVWLDGASNMVKFSTNFTPTVPFTEGGIECVEHTVSNGYPAAQAHDLRLHAADWYTLTHAGTLPTELEARIAQA